MTVVRNTSKSFALRCIALKDGDLFKAVCLDLGLYVERPTLPAAMQELEELIRTYVADSLEAGVSEDRLLRPIPKSERARLYLKLFWSELRASLRDIFGKTKTPGSAATHESRLCYI